MRIVLWIGNEPNQYALANKIASHYAIEGIVLETKKVDGQKKRSISNVIDKLFTKLFFGWVAKAWFKLQNEYKKKYPDLPNCNTIEVLNINDNHTRRFTETLNPDLIIVSGTFLIKTNTLNTECSIGIINLHTGLSPYIKGGPNCTNWCISTGQFQYIGNTIMWIDSGIDSGKIILSEQTSFSGDESFYQIHYKVMEHAHELYLRAIKNIENNCAKSIVQNTIAEGTLYQSKDWNLVAHWNLFKNLKQFHSGRAKSCENILTVS